MALEQSNTHTPSGDKDNQKNFEQEIKELISTLTNRLGGIQRSSNPGDDQGEEESGVGIITLAGSNQGATMRGGMEDKYSDDVEQDDFATYVNSNFQAINNSIMLGGNYETNDPGVHLNIVEDVEDDVDDHDDTKGHGKKVKAHRGHRHQDKAGQGERN